VLTAQGKAGFASFLRPENPTQITLAESAVLHPGDLGFSSFRANHQEFWSL